MSEVQVLKDEAERLLADLEKRTTAAASALEVDLEDLLVKIDHTQLRVAVHRLGLFAEHVERVIIDFVKPTADTAEDEVSDNEAAAAPEDLDGLSRADLNDRAEQAGVEHPDKLPNKQAVIDAIRESEAK